MGVGLQSCEVRIRALEKSSENRLETSYKCISSEHGMEGANMHYNFILTMYRIKAELD